jgi:hypothetical protein
METGSRKVTVIRINLFLLGLISISTQVIMLREALAIFHGNELIIGLFLGIWMLLTAAGAFFFTSGFKSISKITPYRISNIESRISRYPLLLPLLPLATLFLLVTLRYNIAHPE